MRAALTIAGSDPSGGAGIQADLKTFTALGIYGGAAITCLTAQNSRGVAAVSPVAPEFVRQQIALVLADLPVSHLKIGMVGTAGIAVAIGEALAGFRGEIVYDPVLKASAGQPLTTPESLPILEAQLLTRATVLTPNLAELQILSGQSCGNGEEALAAATLLLTRFANLQAIVVKGGHLHEEETEVTDYLLCRGPGGALITEMAGHPRRQSRNTHGTGCTFAAAFCAYHLLGHEYCQAFRLAVEFVDQLLLLSAGYNTGQGTGGLVHHLMRPAK